MTLSHGTDKSDLEINFSVSVCSDPLVISIHICQHIKTTDIQNLLCVKVVAVIGPKQIKIL